MKILYVFLIISFYALPSLATESVVLDKTRIIYNEGDKRSSIGLENKSSRISYLVQTWIEDENHHIAKEFIVTPPLHVSRPGMLKNVELWKVSNGLPSDREVLYYFFEKAVPSIDKKKMDNNNLLIATGNRIKFIYRPSGLKWNIHDAPKNLVFKRKGKDIVVQNPSPYYITMTGINISGSHVGDFMVAPRTTMTIKINIKTKKNKLNFHIINDFGVEEGPYSKDII